MGHGKMTAAALDGCVNKRAKLIIEVEGIKGACPHFSLMRGGRRPSPPPPRGSKYCGHLLLLREVRIILRIFLACGWYVQE